MDLRSARDLVEIGPEFGVKGLRRKAQDLKTAALFRAVGAEGRDHDVTTRLECSPNGIDVSGPGHRIAEKVEHRAIVPEVVGSVRQMNLDFALVLRGRSRTTAETTRVTLA